MNQIRRIVPYSPNKGMQYIFIQAFIITNLTMGMHQPILLNPRAGLLFYSFLLKNKHNFFKMFLSLSNHLEKSKREL